MAFALYLLFVASWFLHLTARIETLGAIRFDLLLICVVAPLAFARRSDVSIADRRRVTNLLLVLMAYAIATLPFVEWPGSVLWFGIPNLTKAVVFFFFTDRLVDSRRKLVMLLLVFVACQTFRVVEPVYLHVTQGYWGSSAAMADWESMDRLSGAPSDIVNPNGLALVILTVIPFVYYLGQLSIPGSIISLAVISVSLYALVLTGSRSGILGLAVVAIAIVAKSRHRIVAIAAVVGLVAVVGPRLGPDMRDRYLSIFSDATRNAGSARGRIDGLASDLSVFLRRPLFGHGLGTSREANGNFAGADQRSHNLYLEVAQELGIGGLAIFGFYLAAIGRAVVKGGRKLRSGEHPDRLYIHTNDALQTWLAMNVLFSFAAYGLSGYEWYFMGGLCCALMRLSSEVSAATPEIEGTATADAGRRADGKSAPTPEFCDA